MRHNPPSLAAQERLAREIIAGTLEEMSADLESRYRGTIASFVSALRGEPFPGSNGLSGIAPQNRVPLAAAANRLGHAKRLADELAATFREVSRAVHPGPDRHVA